MLLPVLGVFGPGDAACMVFGLDDEYAFRGDYDVVYLGSPSVGGGEHEVVDDYEVFLFQEGELSGYHLFASLSAACGFTPPPLCDEPYGQGSEEASADESAE